MPAGRPPKPTWQHIRDGTYQRDRHGQRADMRLCIGTPEKPADLPPLASTLWDTIVDGRPQKYIAACDAAALETVCWWFAEWKEAMDHLRGALSETERKYALKTANICATAFEQGAKDFGLTPADRQRLAQATK